MRMLRFLIKFSVFRKFSKIRIFIIFVTITAYIDSTEINNWYQSSDYPGFVPASELIKLAAWSPKGGIESARVSRN